MVTNIPPDGNSSSRSRTGKSSLANESISESDSEGPLNVAFLRGDSDIDDDIDTPDDTDDDIIDSSESE